MGFSSIEGDDVIIFPKEIAQRQIAERRGENVIEFANLWREVTANDWSRQRTPVARDGIHVAYQDGDAPSGLTDEKTSVVTVKAMPVTLEYSIWFWSQDKDKLNQVSEEYLFWQHQNPNLDIYYNDFYPVEFDLVRFGEIVDESNLPNMFEEGRVFVIRCPLVVEAWVFDSIEQKTIKKIIITIYDHDEIDDIRTFITDETEEEQAKLRLYRETITDA